MPASTRTYKDASGVSRTRIVGANGSGHDVGGIVLYDVDGGLLINQKARAVSIPVTLSTEDIAKLQELVTLLSAALTVEGTVALDTATLTALETVGLDAATLSALETIELGATTLAALETINVNVNAGTNAIGNVGLASRTSGGLSIARSLDVNVASPLAVKNGAGQVYGWYLANMATSARFVKFYNTNAPTVGTTAPVLTVPLPALTAANVSFEHGIAFSTGIGVGATTALADNSTAAPTANDVIANIFYA